MNRNQLKIGVALSYVSTGLNMVIQLVYTPVMIRLLGQSEYGLYTLVGSVVSYLSLFSLGFAGAYLRFYSRYNTKGDQAGVARLNGMFLSLFLVMSIVATTCGMILSQFTKQLFGTNLTPAELAKAKILMQILVINIALTFPSSIFDSIVSAHEQFLFQRVLNLVGIIFNPLICLPLLMLGYGSVAVVGVTTVITIVKLAVNAWYCLKRLKAPFSFRGFDLSLLKEISAFSFFLFLNMIIDQINWSVDKFILGRVSGTIAVAVYGVGYQFNSMFMQLTSIISGVFAPRVNRIVAEKGAKGKKQIDDLLVKVGRIQFMVTLYLFLGIALCGRSFIRWWAGTEYGKAYYVALLLIAPLVIVIPHSLGIEVRRAKNKHAKAAVIMAFTAGLNLIVSIPLAILWQEVGSALGTFLGVIINLIIIDVYYVREVNLDILRLYKNILHICVQTFAAIAFCLAGLYWDRPLINIIWAVVFSALYWCLMYTKGMNNDERMLIYKMIRRLSPKQLKKKGDTKR